MSDRDSSSGGGSGRPPSTQRAAKGVNLILLIKTLRAAQRAGVDLGLDPADQALIDQRVLMSSWYAFTDFLRLIGLVHERLEGGSDEGAFRMGDVAAYDMLQGVHNAFLHRGNSLRTLQSLERIWSQYFNFGALSVECEGDQAIIVIRGYPDMNRTHGLLLLGWARSAVALAGGKASMIDVLDAPWKGATDFRGLIRVESLS